MSTEPVNEAKVVENPTIEQQFEQLSKDFQFLVRNLEALRQSTRELFIEVKEKNGNLAVELHDFGDTFTLRLEKLESEIDVPLIRQEVVHLLALFEKERSA